MNAGLRSVKPSSSQNALARLGPFSYGQHYKVCVCVGGLALRVTSERIGAIHTDRTGFSCVGGGKKGNLFRFEADCCLCHLLASTPSQGCVRCVSVCVAVVSWFHVSFWPLLGLG